MNLRVQFKKNPTTTKKTCSTRMVFIKMQYMQIALFAVSDLCVVYKAQD